VTAIVKKVAMCQSRSQPALFTQADITSRAKPRVASSTASNAAAKPVKLSLGSGFTKNPIQPLPPTPSYKGKEPLKLESPKSKESVALELAAMSLNDYRGCYEYFKQLKPAVIDESDLLDDARRALSQDQEDDAERLIQQAFLYVDYRRIGANEGARDDFFKALQDDGSEERKTFVKSYQEMLQAMREGQEQRRSSKLRYPSRRSTDLVNIDKARDFFVQGKVFATRLYRPTSSGNSLQPEPEPEAYVGRMVVVRSWARHCVCLPISTYRGQGLRDSDDIDNHAIVYARGSKPTRLSGEREFGKKAIEVDVEQGKILHRASRLNFSKPNSIGYGTMVVNIGQVTEKSMEDLVRYYVDTSTTCLLRSATPSVSLVEN
jgi:hypothetical protein